MGIGPEVFSLRPLVTVDAGGVAEAAEASPGLNHTFSKEAELWRFTSHDWQVADVSTDPLVFVEAKVSERCRRRPCGSARITLAPWFCPEMEFTRVNALRPDKGPIRVGLPGAPLNAVASWLGDAEQGGASSASGKASVISILWVSEKLVQDANCMLM